MNLFELSRSIDPDVIERARDYVVNDNILSLYEVADKAYRAEVVGNELYEIYIRLGDEGSVLSSQCNCAYEYGPICKHRVAVMLKLSELHLVSVKPLSIEINSHSKQNLKELLEAESKINLIELLCSLAVDSETLEKRIQLYLSKASGNL